MFSVHADATHLGIEVIEDEEATALLRPLPLQSTLVFLGTIQEQLRPVQDDPVSQGGMLGAFLPLDDDQKLMVAKWITAREDIQHIVLAPHQVMTVQRLALFHCEDRDDTRGLETHEIATLMRLIVNANNTGGPGFSDDATLLRWSVGAPTSESAFSYRYGTALAIHMFGEIAKRDGMNERSDFCDIEAWCQDRYGGSVHELLTIIFMFRVGFMGRHSNGQSAMIRREYLVNTSHAEMARRVIDDIAATPEQLIDQFKEPGGLRAGTRDFDPFRRYPVIRLNDETIAQVAPTLMEQRACEALMSLHFMGMARDRGVFERWLTFHGEIVERTVRDLVAHAAPLANLLEKPNGHDQHWVSGDLRYDNPTETRTSDVLASEPTPNANVLVVGEVTSRRMTQLTRLTAAPEPFENDFEKQYEQKIRQLGDRLRELDIQEQQIDGFEPSAYDEIWPIVIAEVLPLTPLLTDRVMQLDEQSLPDAPTIQPLSVVDMHEFTYLAGMGAQLPGGMAAILRIYHSQQFRRQPFLATINDVAVRENIRQSGMHATMSAIHGGWLVDGEKIANSVLDDGNPRPAEAQK